MMTKPFGLLYGVSMMVTGLCVLINALNSLLNLQLPDALVRGLGVVSLVALAVMVFSFVKCHVKAE